MWPVTDKETPRYPCHTISGAPARQPTRLPLSGSVGFETAGETHRQAAKRKPTPSLARRTTTKSRGHAGQRSNSRGQYSSGSNFDPSVLVFISCVCPSLFPSLLCGERGTLINRKGVNIIPPSLHVALSTCYPPPPLCVCAFGCFSPCFGPVVALLRGSAMIAFAGHMHIPTLRLYFTNE